MSVIDKANQVLADVAKLKESTNRLPESFEDDYGVKPHPKFSPIQDLQIGDKVKEVEVMGQYDTSKPLYVISFSLEGGQLFIGTSHNSRAKPDDSDVLFSHINNIKKA